MNGSNIRIRYPNKRPKTAWGSRIVRGLIGLSVVAIIAALAMWFGVHWAEKTIRERVQEHAARANLEVVVESVRVDFQSTIALNGVTVRDPATQAVLVSVRTIDTDLTFWRALRGARRPSVIRVREAVLNARAHEQLRNAWIRYRNSRRAETKSNTRRKLHLQCSTCQILLPPSAYGTPSSIDNIEARLFPAGTEPGEWHLEGQAVTDQGQQLQTSGIWRPTSSQHEIGLSAQPYVELQAMVPTDSDKTTLSPARVRTQGLYYRHGETIRFHGMSAEVHNAENMTLDVGTLEFDQNEPSTRFDSAFDVHMTNITLRSRTHKATTRYAELSIDAGSPESLLQRLRRIRVQQVQLDENNGSRTAKADQVTLELQGLSLSKPEAGIQSVDIVQANVRLPLPTPNQSKGIPYYEEVQRFLLGDRASPGPGGPAPSALPGSEQNTPIRPSIPPVHIHNSVVTLLSTNAGEPVIELDGLGGGISPDETPGHYHLRLGGQIRDVLTGDRGPFAVDMTTSDTGALHRAHIKLAGSKLAGYAAKQISDSVRLSDSSNLSIDVEVTPMLDTHGFNVKGKMAMRDMGFMAPRIHNLPVDGLQVTAEVQGSIDFEAHKLVLNAPLVELADGKAAFQWTSIIDQLDHDLPRLNVKLKIPKQPCQNLLEAIPPTVIQRLDGLQISGTAAAHFQFEVDLEKPRAFRYDMDVNLKRCRPKNYGKAAVTRLNRNFVHEVVEKGESTGILVGPGTENYRPLNDIPRFIQMGALWTEDHSFFSHQGFRPSLIRRAIILNLERGRYVYGGSTISQQLIKNLYLSREKTLSRKLEEAIIVWLMERAVSKKRILELYLNCIEYGPGLYGIHNAAQRYFGKDVSALSPLEGAFLMGLKPYPWAGWKQFEKGSLDRWWIRRVRKILEGMAKKGWIRADELESSRPFQLVFPSQDRVETDETGDDSEALPRMPSDG